MTDLPKTMKAWYATKRGTPAKVMKLKHDVSLPMLASGDVLVKVQAAALNPIAYKLMGMLPWPVQRHPFIPELDFSGTIADANNTSFAVGDAVYGFIEIALMMRSRQGSLAEYIHVPADLLARTPSNVTPTRAAGLALVGLTAYQALFNVGKLKEGQSVFVNGGSTAVGAFAIQLAKAVGCKVTASASAKNEQYVRDLGADEFIDYTKGPLHETLAALAPSPKFDVFLEAVGLSDGALFARSEAYLAPGGVFVSVGPVPSGASEFMGFAWSVFLQPRFLGGAKRKWKLVQVQSNKGDLEKFTQYVAEGKVKPLVDSVYSFEDLLKAYERLMTKHATGKVVITVDPEVQ